MSVTKACRNLVIYICITILLFNVSTMHLAGIENSISTINAFLYYFLMITIVSGHIAWVLEYPNPLGSISSVAIYSIDLGGKILSMFVCTFIVSILFGLNSYDAELILEETFFNMLDIGTTILGIAIVISFFDLKNLISLVLKKKKQQKQPEVYY